jgi:cell division protein FtsL
MNSIPRITSITKTKSLSKTAKSAGKPIARRSRSNWVGATNVFLIAAIVFSLGFYVYTINGSVSKGYELKQQQAVMEELNETQKRLMVQQAALGSIVKVNEVASTAGMVPVTGEEFLVASQLSAR